MSITTSPSESKGSSDLFSVFATRLQYLHYFRGAELSTPVRLISSPWTTSHRRTHFHTSNSIRNPEDQVACKVRRTSARLVLDKGPRTRMEAVGSWTPGDRALLVLDRLRAMAYTPGGGKRHRLRDQGLRVPGGSQTCVRCRRRRAKLRMKLGVG